MRESAHLVLLLVMATAVMAQQPRIEASGNISMPKDAAQDYIAAFQRGEDFSRPLTGVIVAGQPDKHALQTLGSALAVADPEVREKIVRLLVEIGRSTDPLNQKGADVIRDQEIVALLAGPGLSKRDVGSLAAMRSLRRLVTPAGLEPFGDRFVQTLQDAPTEEAFLLVAKAKPAKDASKIEKFARSPNWKEVDAAKVARAAIGDQEVEREFLNRVTTADSAADGKALAHALASLGLIGTTESLKVVAEHLRTPLTILIPGAIERSVRVDALEALLYNFPDEPVLYPNNINNQEGYLAAEHFCSTKLGVKFTGPPPSFMKYRAFPTPLAK